ncbi:hypothetical protein A3Q56_08792, partial [Intoshia linei]
QLHCSQSTVSRVIHGKKSQCNNSGRIMMSSSIEMRKINIVVKSSRFKSGKELTSILKNSGISLSRSTLYRRLRKLRYRSRVSAVKPNLSL